MKIVLAEHFGMCFGVRDAIAQAEQLAEQAPLTILGELVHNPLVRERLRTQGVREASQHEIENTRIASATHPAAHDPRLRGLPSLQSSQRSTRSRSPGRGGREAPGEGGGAHGSSGLLEASATTSARVMVTAHGASDTKRAMWHERGFHVFDGTCPLV